MVISSFIYFKLKFLNPTMAYENKIVVEIMNVEVEVDDIVEANIHGGQNSDENIHICNNEGMVMAKREKKVLLLNF
ncbi:hypothetical protein KSS87_000966 [Heliosperma pusillum]|nr:hypothetical protein KSS87_000966 [Heliosperma pusillum]